MPLILYSAQDEAGKGIAEELRGSYGFCERGALEGFPAWEAGSAKLVELPQRLVFAENLPFKADYLIFASRHAGSGPACFTVHAPGNWGAAELGGIPKALSASFPSKMKVALREMASRLPRGWVACMEATHHGPFTQTPSLFVEIGSGENEWRDRRAAEVAAGAIMAAVQSQESFPSFFGVGGGHYAPTFTRKMLSPESAIGHILPKYFVDSIDRALFQQGAARCAEKVEGVLIDWKGVSSPQRAKVLSLCRELGLESRKA